MLKEKSSSACEANPKVDSCSHSGGEDVTGDHRLGPADSVPRDDLPARSDLRLPGMMPVRRSRLTCRRSVYPSA
jgi:hypothetical protein